MLQKNKELINNKSVEGINKNILDMINTNIKIGRNLEKYNKLNNAREFYKYAKQGLNEIIILRINKYKTERIEKKGVILLDDNNQLFKEIKKEEKKEEEINKNINRINKKIEDRKIKRMKQEKKEYLEALLREDII